MKYKVGDGLRLLKKSEVIPKGAQRKVAADPQAAWVPTRAAGKTLTAKAPKEAKPREIVLELLSDGKGHEFPEIHSILTAKVGKRTEKATRVLLQDLKDSGLLAASAVEYSKVSKGVAG